ncbi:3-dehydroquinate synthase [Litoribrevibacter euphylliae]|uniref:3-dehydroquinate synthase n=1 Tax=Litoribrevibacter euphylliae TaxID=1834034 RepID=A0ABV7HM09_9GAMM
MKTLNVDLGERSYPIFIGEGLLGNPELITPYIAGQQVMVVTNETVAPLYLEKLKSSLIGFQVDEVILPDGERYKNSESIDLIYSELLKKRHNRKTTLIALGGGVVGDMCGFAAATYQRGVDFIQVPTTLLSQVDSSVGGKTGINHSLGKNMIGAFHQPKVVIADTDTLKTLPERELSAGIAEVIKYGLIRDEAFLSWIEDNMSDMLACNPEVLTKAIHESCRNKAEIVAEDELESGCRALLNLGHTFGHAIEAHQGYGNWLHGEAVGAGMIMAAYMSKELGWLDEVAFQRVSEVVESAKLPIKSPESMTKDDFISYMSLDKKNLDHRIRLVLLKSVGEAFITADYPQESFLKTLSDC